MHKAILPPSAGKKVSHKTCRPDWSQTQGIFFATPGVGCPEISEGLGASPPRHGFAWKRLRRTKGRARAAGLDSARKPPETQKGPPNSGAQKEPGLHYRRRASHGSAGPGPAPCPRGARKRPRDWGTGAGAPVATKPRGFSDGQHGFRRHEKSLVETLTFCNGARTLREHLPRAFLLLPPPFCAPRGCARSP